MTLSCYHVWQLLALGLIQPHTRLDYLPLIASPITSSTDHQKKTKSQISVHVSKKESEVYTVSNHKGMICKLIISKEQILANYSDAFDSIGCFSGPPYHIQVDPSVTPKQTYLLNQSQCILIESLLRKRSTIRYKVGVLKPVNQAIPLDQQFSSYRGKR